MTQPKTNTIQYIHKINQIWKNLIKYYYNNRKKDLKEKKSVEFSNFLTHTVKFCAESINLRMLPNKSIVKIQNLIWVQEKIKGTFCHRIPD